MKTMKNIIMIVAFLLIIPMVLSAMGRGEMTYAEVLDDELTIIVEQLEAGDLELEAAIEMLHDLRIKNSRANTEDYQVMEKTMAEVQNQTMTAAQAMMQLRQLKECSTDPAGEQVMVQEQIRIQDRNEDDEQGKVQNQSGEAYSGEDVPGQPANENAPKENGNS